MSAAQTILVVEDEHALGTALSFAVRRIGHLPELVATGSAAIDAARRSVPQAAVIDIGLPDMSGLDLIKKLRVLAPTLPVLIITAHGSLEHAIAARRQGATEFLVKPLDLRQFEASVRALLDQASAAKPSAKAASRAADKSMLIGSAPALQEVFAGVSRACVTDTPVLITGPTGSGKSLVASVIHAHGNQQKGSCQTVNASMLTTPGELAALLEDRSERTIILEGISELPQPLQTQLAGCVSAPGHTIRWIMTSTESPMNAMQRGALRPELYYALTALHLVMPPLRELSSDIPALAEHFLSQSGGPRRRLSAASLHALQRYDWPGNVIELKHALALASELATDGVISPAHLPAHFAERLEEGGMPSGSAPTDLQAVMARWVSARLKEAGPDHLTYEELLDQMEGLLLEQLLRHHENKPTHLANALRMNRTTLRTKLRRLGLHSGD